MPPMGALPPALTTIGATPSATASGAAHCPPLPLPSVHACHARRWLAVCWPLFSDCLPYQAAHRPLHTIIITCCNCLIAASGCIGRHICVPESLL